MPRNPDHDRAMYYLAKAALAKPGERIVGIVTPAADALNFNFPSAVSYRGGRLLIGSRFLASVPMGHRNHHWRSQFISHAIRYGPREPLEIGLRCYVEWYEEKFLPRPSVKPPRRRITSAAKGL